jgi:hypothetical protein
MSLQKFAEGPGSQFMRVRDLKPGTHSAMVGGVRWKAGDPEPPPIYMAYVDACENCTRNPLRYRPVGMSDDEHRALVADFNKRTAR